MAGEIKHKWNGTILTITSDSGTSSCDLKGRQGDDGCRGPQGPAGITTDANGNVICEGLATEEYVREQIRKVEQNKVDVDLSNYYTKSEVDATLSNIEVDLSNYYTKSEVDEAIENVEVDLSDYSTKEYVNMKIAEAQLDGEGNTIDLSMYYTKNEVNALIPDTTGFITISDVEAKGYQTAEQVRQIVINNLPKSGEEVYY